MMITTSAVMADNTTEPSKTEQILTTVSEKAEAAAAKTADSVKSGSQKAGIFIKEKSIIAKDKTLIHARKGADKAKRATVRGANKFSNATAKGLKKAAEKMQDSADRTIERTDRNLQESMPKCNCKQQQCPCSDNCDCDNDINTKYE